MININPTPLRIVTIILVTGIVLFILALIMPRYNVPGIERQLDALSSSDGDHDNYYKIRDAASTNKYLYADLGSGLIVFAIALYAFLSTQNINKFKDVKKIPAISTGRAYALANMAVLILIPGTAWYYGLRSARGDYPPFADSIGIPITEQCAGFLILLIPLNIYLLIAAVKSRQPALIFSKGEDHYFAIGIVGAILRCSAFLGCNMCTVVYHGRRPLPYNCIHVYGVCCA